MFELRCTVRNCSELLHRRERAMICANGHHFDQAKEGYWNLLQPQDRKSKNPGDSESAVLARHRWLARGHASGLIDALAPWIGLTRHSASMRTIDLGCGEGSFGSALFAGESDEYCGIELSKRAIKLAARAWPEATWVLANADRVLPAADASVDRVVSMFGRRPVSEIARVLMPYGSCIVAVPGEHDLIELRQHVQQSGHRRSRWKAIVDEMTSNGLEYLEHKLWQWQIDLDPEAISDALAMTYRGKRHSQQSRVESIEAMKVTLAADLILMRRKLQ